MLGGWLASLVGWPLPWMIGSLLAVMLVRCLADLPLAEVPGARKCGQWIVGIGIGLHFTPAVIEQVLAHSVIIVFGAVATTLSSVLAIAFMRRSGEDRATAFFASMPGGASEMVNLGQRHGAVLSRVAAAQSLRLLLVVLLVPAAVGVMAYAREIAADFWAIVGALVLSLVLSFLFAGWMMQKLIDRQQRRREES